MNHAASNSDKTSTLMIILTDRLRMYLKPNQELGVEVPYVQKENDDDDDDDDNNSNNNNNNNNDNN